jgi:cell division protein FtsB
MDHLSHWSLSAEEYAAAFAMVFFTAWIQMTGLRIYWVAGTVGDEIRREIGKKLKELRDETEKMRNEIKKLRDEIDEIKKLRIKELY